MDFGVDRMDCGRSNYSHHPIQLRCCTMTGSQSAVTFLSMLTLLSIGAYVSDRALRMAAGIVLVALGFILLIPQ